MCSAHTHVYIHLYFCISDYLVKPQVCTHRRSVRLAFFLPPTLTVKNPVPVVLKSFASLVNPPCVLCVTLSPAWPLPHMWMPPQPGWALTPSLLWARRLPLSPCLVDLSCMVFGLKCSGWARGRGYILVSRDHPVSRGLS